MTGFTPGIEVVLTPGGFFTTACSEYDSDLAIRVVHDCSLRPFSELGQLDDYPDIDGWYRPEDYKYYTNDPGVLNPHTYNPSTKPKDDYRFLLPDNLRHHLVSTYTRRAHYAVRTYGDKCPDFIIVLEDSRERQRGRIGDKVVTRVIGAIVPQPMKGKEDSFGVYHTLYTDKDIIPISQFTSVQILRGIYCTPHNTKPKPATMYWIYMIVAKRYKIGYSPDYNAIVDAYTEGWTHVNDPIGLMRDTYGHHIELYTGDDPVVREWGLGGPLYVMSDIAYSLIGRDTNYALPMDGKMYFRIPSKDDLLDHIDNRLSGVVDGMTRIVLKDLLKKVVDKAILPIVKRDISDDSIINTMSKMNISPQYVSTQDLTPEILFKAAPRCMKGVLSGEAKNPIRYKVAIVVEGAARSAHVNVIDLGLMFAKTLSGPKREERHAEFMYQIEQYRKKPKQTPTICGRMRGLKHYDEGPVCPFQSFGDMYNNVKLCCKDLPGDIDFTTITPAEVWVRMAEHSVGIVKPSKA